ncbi:glucose-6-phosphate exchanger SLC37A4 [Tetranychus urticae]|uniref:Major facilitator superfamily (MFS) profile domain-containing protein n=1 Tax=Tetranychus urticae TaxID=32264 RepID=T1K7R5_TETUR|nr:glucose-6-phosphate exchanger SLC37A4 [Tetranychus urticae]
MSISKETKLKRFQFNIFTSLFLGYGSYGLNRKSVSLAMPSMMGQGLGTNEAGLIASSQNLAYAISKFAGGILSDRISARLLFSFGLIASGLITIAFSFSDSVSVFTGLWFLNGLAQGAGWPACAKLLREWYDPVSFGTWWSLLSASINISGGISPFVAAFLTTTYGWRTSIFFSGAVSVFFGVVALLFLINSPTEIGLKGFGQSQKQDKKGKSQGKETINDLIKSPMLWIVAIAYMSVSCSKTSSTDWGQVYLMEERKQSQYVASGFTSSIESGGFVGSIFAGWLTDVYLKLRKEKNTVKGRMPVAILMMIGLAVCFHLLYFQITPDTTKFTIASIGFVLGACLYGPIALFGILATESAPLHLSGTAHAIVALSANVGAIISGLPFSYVAAFYSWGSIFFLLEIVTIFTVFIMCFYVKFIPSDKRKAE